MIWDRLEVVIESSPEYPYQGDTITLNWRIMREYDASTVTTFIINITKDDVLWKAGLITNSTTDVEEDVASHNYNCINVVDNTFGLTKWVSNSLTVTWEKIVEPSIPTTMIYIDPMSLILLIVVFIWVLIVVSGVLSLRP